MSHARVSFVRLAVIDFPISWIRSTHRVTLARRTLYCSIQSRVGEDSHESMLTSYRILVISITIVAIFVRFMVQCVYHLRRIWCKLDLQHPFVRCVSDIQPHACNAPRTFLALVYVLKFYSGWKSALSRVWNREL